MEWRTSKLRKRIQIIVILMARVFRKKDASRFPKKWIPIIHHFITHGSTLNWGEIISSNLDIQLKKVQKKHQFYMSSYLSDVMCASQEYPSLGWKCKFNLQSIHVYCKMIWENRYKEDYELRIFSIIYQV